VPKIFCPKCRKSSYTPDVESSNSCPHCGFEFTAKLPSDRRREPRVERQIPFDFSYQDRNFMASTTDLSDRGVGIEVYGEVSIEEGDILTLTIEDTTIRAKIMWVEKLPNKARAGLEKLN
jgi:hypothetical protein